MKTKRLLQTASLVLVSVFNLPPSALLAQGSLSPPGAPAPTMKTLAQIEPRTPIASAPYTISVAGSYYLTTNVTVSSGDAITIATNNVTLDLNGFTISSTAPSATGNGIYLSGGLRNITICNGFIQGGVTNNGSGVYGGGGFDYGIGFMGLQPANVRVTGLSISGCLTWGISLGNAWSVVESCTLRTMGTYGIGAAVVKNTSVVECGVTAIAGNEVSGCHGESTGSDVAVSAVTALNSLGKSVSGIGLQAAVANNCLGQSTSGIGLTATAAQNCYGYSTSGAAGLNATNASFCTGYRSGGRAIQATIATGCLAIAGTNLITYKYNMP